MFQELEAPCGAMKGSRGECRESRQGRALKAMTNNFLGSRNDEMPLKVLSKTGNFIYIFKRSLCLLGRQSGCREQEWEEGEELGACCRGLSLIGVEGEGTQKWRDSRYKS